MNKPINIIIEKDGTIRFLYDYNSNKNEKFSKEILKLGKSEINRKSQIDPVITKQGVKYFVDLKLVNGPKLGPFASRTKAIDAEVKWLLNNYF